LMFDELPLRGVYRAMLLRDIAEPLPKPRSPEQSRELQSVSVVCWAASIRRSNSQQAVRVLRSPAAASRRPSP
jgi:hypothetical protein